MSAADDLRALAAAATPGPWTPDRPRFPNIVCVNDNPAAFVAAFLEDPDADLIVWLVNHAQAIADLIEYADDAVRFEHSPSHMGALADALAALEADT